MERDWLDYAALTATWLTFWVTAFGLFFVWRSLSDSSHQQRVESGPYVRVDLGPTQGEKSGFNPPDPYFEDVSQVLRLYGPSKTEPSTSLSAWFRNYQSHPLGVAFGVTATFLVEFSQGSESNTLSHRLDVEIPYLEHGKAVKIQLTEFPAQWDMTAQLVSLTLHDLYDQEHQHTYGSRGTSALHGRLACEFIDGAFESIPEGRSRGAGVDFNLG